MLTNFHTHTYRCIHAAQVPDEEYVTTAIKSGYDILGFSDHTPWPYDSGYVSKNERMTIGALPEYISSLKNLREKYAGQIDIRIGLECEYFPKYFDWLRCTAKEFDYLILGNHFALTDEFGDPYFGKAATPGRMEEYTTYTLAGMGSGLFDYLAHPELPFADYPGFDDAAQTLSRMICREAKALDMPIEYNLYGTVKRDGGRFNGLGYPSENFWNIAAEYGCRVIIGVDAHRPEHLADVPRVRRAEEYIRSLGMQLITVPDRLK